jgi:hypothetical protein
VCAIVLGVTAAAVVWALERFETERMFGEMRAYLEKHDAFRRYEEQHGGD